MSPSPESAPTVDEDDAATVERKNDEARAKLGLPLAHRHAFKDGKCECGHPDPESLPRVVRRK